MMNLCYVIGDFNCKYVLPYDDFSCVYHMYDVTVWRPADIVYDRTSSVFARSADGDLHADSGWGGCD